MTLDHLYGELLSPMVTPTSKLLTRKVALLRKLWFIFLYSSVYQIIFLKGENIYFFY